MKTIHGTKIHIFMWIFFYLSTVNVEGASVNHGCNKGDGTEGITGCIYLS